MEAAETALLLACVQFAFTVSFHFLFPSFSIGLASYLAVLEGLWLWTKNHLRDRLLRRVFGGHLVHPEADGATTECR